MVSPEDFEKVQQTKKERYHMYGRAKTGNRGLLSGLIICTKCNYPFQRTYSNYIRGGIKKRFYYYSDSGYRRGGKHACKLTNVPLLLINEWVLGHIKQLLLGDHKTVQKAIDTFVKKVRSGKETPDDSARLKKELNAVNRRIQATLAMLADPSFEGLDEIKRNLSDLKSRRDSLRKGRGLPILYITLSANRSPDGQ